MNKTSISILTKSPEPGKVKTRFELDAKEAANIYSSFLKTLHQTSDSTQLDGLWFIDGDLKYLKLDIPKGALYLQKGDSLSDRIKHAFDISKHLGYQNTIIIGGDSPELEGIDFKEVSLALENKIAQTVLGPSFDGGIYLLGQNLESDDDYLDDMIWSTESVYADLKTNLDNESISYISREPKHDIDTKEDYSKYLERRRN